MNKQPYYHRVDGLLFTSTECVSYQKLMEILRRSKELEELGILVDSIEIEQVEWEAGDPADLV